MKTTELMCSLVLTALTAAGCASVPLANSKADKAAKSFAVKPGLANIYIYRTESVGAAVEVAVMVDGVPLGRTAEKTFAVMQVHPGKHTITSRAEGDATLDIVAVANQNYFVQQELVPGFRRARSQLHLADETEGRRYVKKYRLIE
jgi:hypothetical protein